MEDGLVNNDGKKEKVGEIQKGNSLSNERNSNEKGEQSHAIPLTSRLSDASMGKERRSVKRGKRLGGSSDAGSTIK
jgi:hypothetical protein